MRNDQYGNQEGAVALEYGYLILFVAIAIAIGGSVLGLALAGVFEDSGTTIGEAEIPAAPALDAAD